MNDKSRKAMWVKINHGNVNQTEVDDIVLTQENNGDFHHRFVEPNTNALLKRMVGGKFTMKEAMEKKGFVERVGRETVNDYFKNYGGVPHGLTSDTKKKVGQEMIEQMVDNARERARTHPKIMKPNKRHFMEHESHKRITDDNNIEQHMRKMYN